MTRRRGVSSTRWAAVPRNVTGSGVSPPSNATTARCCWTGVGVVEGWQAIDLGCGPSRILDLLADRAGPAGHVVGLDFEPANVALAREFATERGLANVEVIQGDARRTGFPSASYDLVHARTLLVNIPDPATVVAEMVRLAQPGGWVAVLEPDGGREHVLPSAPGLGPADPDIPERPAGGRR
jgi:ubiquinone/menaquinone biosynthesis C-methylase UbiE